MGVKLLYQDHDISPLSIQAGQLVLLSLTLSVVEEDRET